MKLPSQIATFLLCVLGVFGASCPAEEDVYPCTCKEHFSGELFVTCSGVKISQLGIQTALSKIGQEDIVHLKLNDIDGLGKLKGDLFAGHNIRILEIEYCDIEDVTDGLKPAFSGLEDSLQELTISDVTNDGFSSLQLNHLQNLQKLYLLANHLNVLKDECFPSSLLSLMLFKNEVKGVSDRAFANLDKLIALDLDSNKLKTFKRSWFPVPSDKLRSFNIDNNQLTNLPRDAFSNMPSLARVYLANNDIQSMERETWALLWQQLTKIDMEENPLVCDSSMEWIRQVKSKVDLLGTCHEPAHLAGLHLSKWIEQASLK